MPGRGGRGNIKKAIAKVEKDTAGSIRSSESTHSSVLSTSQKTQCVRTARSAAKRAPKPISVDTTAKIAELASSPPTPMDVFDVDSISVAPHDYQYYDFDKMSTAGSTSVTSYTDSILSQQIASRRGGRGGLGNTPKEAKSHVSPINDLRGAAMMSASDLSISGEAGQWAIVITRDWKVDFSPANISVQT